MSDRAIGGNVASRIGSPADFDARLKASDENRWLAARYAPAVERERLVAIYLAHQELQRALAVPEPMLGKIRVQWWRETFGRLKRKLAHERHDLAQELARTLGDRADLIDGMEELIDRFDDVVDDHLAVGGHADDETHAARHLAAEATLTRLAGRALSAEVTIQELEALSRVGEAHLAELAGFVDRSRRWEVAKAASRGLRPALWPAIAHVSAVCGPHSGDRGQFAPLSKRWRMLRVVARRRL